MVEGDAGGDGESDIEIVLEGMVRLPEGDLLLSVGIAQPVLSAISVENDMRLQACKAQESADGEWLGRFRLIP